MTQWLGHWLSNRRGTETVSALIGGVSRCTRGMRWQRSARLRSGVFQAQNADSPDRSRAPGCCRVVPRLRWGEPARLTQSPAMVLWSDEMDPETKETLPANPFPRACSIVFAAGGFFWALLLTWYASFFFFYSAAGGLIWVLVWLPGFIAWYGYIRRACGHFLLRKALITWLVSIIANAWSVLIVWLARDRHPPLILGAAFLWFGFALVVSGACAVLERRLQNPKADICRQVSPDELRRLLDDHRRATAR